MSDDAERNMARRIRGGFTIVELLIVIAMIILLLSILVVAVNRAGRTAQITNTRALMNSISQALVRFKEDVGYYPPVLAPEDPLNPVDADEFRNLKYRFTGNLSNYEAEVQHWFSYTSLAEYLLGYGEGVEDGYGYANFDETPTTGIRDPGPDGLWGGSVDRNGDGTIDLDDRNPPIEGKRYGPYLQLKDERLLGSTDGSMDSFGNLNVYFPGERNYDPDDPKVITDYWGRPIRYYRTVYKPGAIKYPFRAAVLGDFTPTLADVFVLRPWEVTSGAESDSTILDFLDDGTASYELKTAASALFSPGPDRSQDETTRFDANDGDGDEISGENEDNIVEVGP
ncbi:MAG: type II secretion system protein [Phycisphaerales bacterium]